MKPYIIYLLMFTMLLSGCAHTTSSPYLNNSYHNENSTFENIVGFGILAVATTGLVLAAVNSNHYEPAPHYKHSYSDRHNNRHQRPNKTKPSKKPHKT